eukprot:1143156-Pelagomonas_calceolata.AAC.2
MGASMVLLGTQGRTLHVYSPGLMPCSCTPLGPRVCAAGQNRGGAASAGSTLQPGVQAYVLLPSELLF